MNDFLFGSQPKRRKKNDNPFAGLNEAIYGKPSKSKQSENMLGGSLGWSGNTSSNEPKERDSRRSFSQTQRKEILYQQNNKCARCHKDLDPRDIEFDHIKPWADKGRTVLVNGRALCGSCHKIVTHEHRLKNIDKKRTTKKEDNPFGLPRFKF